MDELFGSRSILRDGLKLSAPLPFDEVEDQVALTQCRPAASRKDTPLCVLPNTGKSDECTVDKKEIDTLLKKYLEQSALELFADIGAQFEPIEYTVPLPDVTAIVGIAGPSVAGSIALCTSATALTALAKLGQASMPEDWLGELANQLVGRFKRKVTSHGVAFSLGTPTIVAGEKLHVVVGRAREEGLRSRLTSSFGDVEVWMEFELREGCEITADATDNGALMEGEAVLL